MNETFRTLMESRFDRLEQNFASLKRDWLDTNDKLMHLYDRTRKRIKAHENASEEEKPSEPVEEVQTRADILKIHDQRQRSA